MTKQEVKALGARLTRLWRPEKVTLCKLNEYEVLVWEARIQESMFLSFVLNPDYPDDPFIDLSLGRYQTEEFVARLFLERESKILEVRARTRSIRLRRRMDQFFSEWRPFFRRGCWLSGGVIEATMHEKLEWIQGFTREEIQAWNLKI